MDSRPPLTTTLLTPANADRRAQVARYTDSQRYVDHYDAVDPHSPAGRSFCANGGQRVATVLMYLNDVREGGSTYFRLLDLTIQV